MPATNRELERLALQSRLDAEKTQAQRNKLGQFATPSHLAIEIVQSSLELLPRDAPIRFLDPAFGTGSFYSALLSKLSPGRLKAAKGFEVDPHYGGPAKSLWGETGLDLELADFTEADPPPRKFNLIVCNPPYVRHHHLSPHQKQSLKQAVGRFTELELNGLSGLYCYFMALSKAWMTADGIGVWLVPSEFMDVNYGTKLKQFLLDRVTLQRIHRFDPSQIQFDDALVSSAVVFFQNSPPDPSHTVSFTYGGTLSEPTISDEVAIPQLRDISKWTALPHSVRLESERSNERTLADLFTIKRGLATGSNSFFVLPLEEADRLRLPPQFLVPILPSPRDINGDEIKADSLGYPRIEKRLVLLSCELPEDEVEREFPALWNYLQAGVEDGIANAYLCAHRSPWYLQEKRPPAPFLCTYMGRNIRGRRSPFRFFLNLSKATAANVYLMLYPKPALASIIKQHPDCLRSILRGLSSITPELMIGEGHIYGGGLHKLEPKELARVPAEIVLRDIGRKIELEMQQTLF